MSIKLKIKLDHFTLQVHRRKNSGDFSVKCFYRISLLNVFIEPLNRLDDDFGRKGRLFPTPDKIVLTESGLVTTSINGSQP